MVSTLSLSWVLPIPQKRRSSENQVRSRLSSLSSLTIFSELEPSKQRRSASYHPTVWETSRILTFVTPYSYKLHGGRLEELKQLARLSLKTTEKGNPRKLLRIVDSMQRLGIAYHFRDEIREAISRLDSRGSTDDLYTASLKFRILRENGLSATSDLFNRFRGPDGKFLERLSDDVEGILSLYEASYLGIPGEDVLDEAEDFATRKLEQVSSGESLTRSCLAKQVKRSLEVPLHLRLSRVEARNFVELYELDETKDPNLLELAKLDYNLVQSLYQDELKDLASWWRDLGLKENLEFARDRLMENYLWAMGITPEPQFSKCRVGLAKFICILTVIDDVYDVYGYLDELEYFTMAVGRWDIEAMMNLPRYMKLCYLAMANFGNELIYDVIEKHGLDVSTYIREEWLNLCKSYLEEARWYCSGDRPTFEEYLGNACTSVGGRAAIIHACILQLDCSIPKTFLESCLNNASDLIHYSSLVLRFADDLGTSKDEGKRGDVAKSVECYAKEKNVSDEEAQIRIREMIRQSWKMMNKEMIINSNGLPNSMVRMCLNMARTAQLIFQHGDGIGTSTGVTRDRLTSLILKPIPLDIPM